ncbi:class I SAM-dependent methyltransferase [Exiguobacterium sp. s142]|uniref:class I SAM-dependent methyltransferase n=1 Tax=Exiguobacterium sp. s142 TaxID=2751222 RepID=UPI002036F563|nr:class I SAM-dependent methyltransferase [Exiguobacterium sp. s142]
MKTLMIDTLFNRLDANIPFAVQFADGTVNQYGHEEPRLYLKLNEGFSLTRLLKEPSIAFGEAYMDGDIEIDGDIEDIISLALHNKQELWNVNVPKLPNLSIRKAKQNIEHHYDIGNEFYALWLDETMSYSCAYFKEPYDSLNQAQLNKIDHVLNKLQLKEGETLLDIGSGWGELIIRAARAYGVRSHGVTLSEEQYAKTKARIEELGLEDQVTVELMDYRELVHSGLTFDKISSVGMFEHVGQKDYPTFMKTVNTLLKDKGMALLHTITHQTEEAGDPWIQKYIFPGGYIPSLREIVTLLPEYNFHVVDIESLRLHYAQTLDHWSSRFETTIDRSEEMYGERFIRMWRLYLQSSAAFFRNGGLDLHQTLFTKHVNNDLNMTRAHLYE